MSYITQNDPCIMCEATALIPVYRAPTTQRDLTVHVCSQCGLVQSWPRIDHVEKRGEANPSTDADFGNIRYGKSFSVNQAKNVYRHILTNNTSIFGGHYLDVGGGRGEMAACVDSIFSPSELTVIEPDERLQPVESNPRMTWITDRIENVEFESELYDFVTCIHTLEHLADPLSVLRQIYTAMTENGWLYVEVPNLDYLTKTEEISEFFIDKHLTFFARRSLEEFLHKAGFTYIVEFQYGSNIGGLCEKFRRPSPPTFIADTFKLIGDYSNRRKELQSVVDENVATLNTAIQNGLRVVFWGAGRIFDSYVRAGLNVKGLAGLVDLYLPESQFDLIRNPKHLPYCDLLVIASNEYDQEIRNQFTDSYRCENRPHVKSWKEKV